MHYDSPPLACPILFCSASNLFPFHWQRPSFPPLSLCCGIPLIFSSLAGQGVTEAEEWGGEGGRNAKFCLVLILVDYTSTQLLLLHLLWSSFCGFLCSKRWQSLGSNSEVGTFDRYVTHGLVADRCATGNAVRCGRLRHMLCIFSAFWLSDKGVCKCVVKASFSSGLSFIGTHKCTLSSCLVNAVRCFRFYHHCFKHTFFSFI